jgi:hypothetical protein
MTNERMHEICFKLRGTCLSIEDVLEEGETETIELNKIIDMEIFRCDRCAWWFEINEMAVDEDWCCQQCSD